VTLCVTFSLAATAVFYCCRSPTKFPLGPALNTTSSCLCAFVFVCVLCPLAPTRGGVAWCLCPRVAGHQGVCCVHLRPRAAGWLGACAHAWQGTKVCVCCVCGVCVHLRTRGAGHPGKRASCSSATHLVCHSVFSHNIRHHSMVANLMASASIHVGAVGALCPGGCLCACI
jgi:hypothetical protein